MRDRTAQGGRWYAGGLRFECLPDCAACCTNHGEYAYVYLESGDAARLAGYLGLGLTELHERYTGSHDGHVFLRMKDPDCPFLDGARCAVYPARPVQCRSFPFWKENLRSRTSWRRLARFCPGIDQGKLHGLLRIEENLEARGTAD